MELTLTKHASERLYERFFVEIDAYTKIPADTMKKSDLYEHVHTGKVCQAFVTKLNKELCILVADYESGKVLTVLGPHRTPEFDYLAKSAGVSL